MPRDSLGRLDPEVVADILVKKSEDPSTSASAPASEVCFMEKDDWWIAWEATDPSVSHRFVLPWGPNGRVSSEILEFVMAEVKGRGCGCSGGFGGGSARGRARFFNLRCVPLPDRTFIFLNLEGLYFC